MGELTYSEALIDEFVATLNVFYGNYGADQTYDYIDGSSVDDLRVTIYNGWIETGRYDLDTQLGLEGHNRSDATSWHTRANSYWVLALNKAILQNENIIPLYSAY